MKLRTLKGVNVRNKRVLMHVDFNVTLNHDRSTITNDQRIVETLPTIRYLLRNKATVIMASHLGRPGGKVVKELSLAPVVKRLKHYLKKDVFLLEDFWKKKAVEHVSQLPPSSVVMLENIRFHPGEEGNDPVFIKHLASFADLFVNDAFGTAHRAHASTVGVSVHLPAYAGFLLEKEVNIIGRALTRPKRPFVLVIGGGKTPEKIRVIEKLLDTADSIYLGGAIANTFFAMWGISVGVSKVDHEMIEMARQVFWKASRVPSRLILPADVVVTNGIRSTHPFVLPYDKVPASLGIFDIGPKSIVELQAVIGTAKTTIWNGPMGMYEDPRFVRGTEETLKAITHNQGETIVGGGDTISIIKDKNLLKKITHISTGGGSMLEFMEKGTLPVVEALKK